MVLDTERAITLGHPSYVWRSGQERRLSLIRRYAPLDGMRVLDIGCGLGAYVANFGRFTDEAYGMDVDPPRVQEGRRRGIGNLLLAAAESLPFAAGTFDVIVLNEVIEHVRDDRATLREALRILRPGGSVVIFAPNRLYPFETHGVYLGKRYVFGNIPLVNWLPNPVRNRVVPHARAYLRGDIRRLVRRLPADMLVHGYVYPGFDNIAGRSPGGATLLRKVLYLLESTPLNRFGLSHFVVLRRRA
ncbi:MAG: class I SAM-dependent methyltransferase [Dehalococcoidia bacterium]